MNGRAATWLLPAGFLLAIALVWEAAVQWGNMPRYILPRAVRNIGCYR